MPIYYTTRDRAKAESKGHRFEQDYNVFCSSDQEHKPLWQFSYAHGLVVGIEELADPEDPDQETQSFAILFDIATNCIERRQYASSRIPSIGCQAVVDASPEILERCGGPVEELQHREPLTGRGGSQRDPRGREVEGFADDIRHRALQHRPRCERREQTLGDGGQAYAKSTGVAS